MALIIFIVIIIISVTFRSSLPYSKGTLGEKRVAYILSHLPSKKYKITHDILIESYNRTVQIDHLVLSIYGIFVIETKNYNGWIIGSDNSEYWTQNIFGNKYKFYNPIKQNNAHIAALSKRLGISSNKFISIIVFLDEADLEIYTTHNVVYISEVNELIKNYFDIRFSEEEIQKLYEKISSLNIVSSKARRQHVSEVQNMISNKHYLIQQGICPRCGHSLVFRSGKYGDFFGCSNYPKCKFRISKK